jgi:hypothetical protein
MIDLKTLYNFLDYFKLYLEIIIYLIGLLGVFTFAREFIRHRKEKENNAYNSIDDKFVDFLKLGIQDPEIRVLPSEITQKIRQVSISELTLKSEEVVVKNGTDCTSYKDVEVNLKNPVYTNSFFNPKMKQFVAFEILTSLFERAFLMYENQSTSFRNEQWKGWDSYIKIWMKDPEYKNSWEKMGTTWEVKFEEYMKEVFATPDLPYKEKSWWDRTKNWFC